MRPMLILPSPKDAKHVALLWLAFAVVVAFAMLASWSMDGWLRMAVVSVAMFAALKAMALIEAMRGIKDVPSRVHVLAYLLLWPGMNARTFLAGQPPARPALNEWIGASFTTATGIGLLLAVQPALADWPAARAWAGMVGIVLTLHFGAFRLISCALRRIGFDAPPLMRMPVAAARVADFWGRRWNTAFSDFATALIFRPAARIASPTVAGFLVFAASGAIHEAAISFPARGGYGGPFAYFMIQWVGLTAERTNRSAALIARRPWTGRLLAFAVTVLPLPMLFHEPFRSRVILPLLSAVGGIIQ